MKPAIFAILLLASSAVGAEKRHHSTTNNSTTTTTTAPADANSLNNGDGSVAPQPTPVTTSTTTTNNASTTEVAEKHDHPSSRAGVGIHGGLNFNNPNFGSGNALSRTGWFAGLHFEGWGWDVIAIRPEVSYSVRGYEVANAVRVNNNYIDVPLLFKVTPFSGPVKLYVEAGPMVSFHLNTTYEAAGAATTVNPATNEWDFGILGGVGLGFLIADHALLHVEGRYDWGLKSIASNSTTDIKTRTAQALLGITFLSN